MAKETSLGEVRVPKLLYETLGRRIQTAQGLNIEKWKTNSYAIGMDAVKALKVWLDLNTEKQLSENIACGTRNNLELRNTKPAHVLSAALLYSTNPDKWIELRSKNKNPKMLAEQEIKIIEQLCRLETSHEKLIDPNATKEEYEKTLDAIKNTHVLIRLISAAKAHAEFFHIKDAPKEEAEKLAYKMLLGYAPLLKGAGLYKLGTQLEDEALAIANPEAYKRIDKETDFLKKNLPDIRKSIVDRLTHLFKDIDGKDIDGLKIEVGLKGIPSIYRKLHEKIDAADKSGVENVNDSYELRRARYLTGSVQDMIEGIAKNPDVRSITDNLRIRILYNGNKHQYGEILAKLKTLKSLAGFKIGRFEEKDFTGENRKPNTYEALHVKMFGDKKDPNLFLNAIEAQIVPNDVHKRNERGPAAHVIYEGMELLPEPQEHLCFAPEVKRVGWHAFRHEERF